MKSTRRLGVLFAVFVTVAVATPAEAQLGGLLRRGREALNPKPEPEPQPAAPAAAPASDPFADPSIVRITEDQLGRFEKALRYEIAQRDELRDEIRKLLAAIKTPEEYQSCAQAVATSPEAMKISQDWADQNANASTEQLLAATEKMQVDLAAMVSERCGISPEEGARRRDERTRSRMTSIEGEASDIAMPPGWTPPPGSLAQRQGEGPWDIETPVVEEFLVAAGQRSRGPSFMEVEAVAAAAAQIPHPFLRAYAMLKERIPVFCFQLDTKIKLPFTETTIGTTKVLVVKIPGVGGNSYVYAENEAGALTKGCSTVMPLLSELQ